MKSHSCLTLPVGCVVAVCACMSESGQGEALRLKWKRNKCLRLRNTSWKKPCFKKDLIFRYDTRAQVIKGKTDNLDLIKVKNFYVSEDTTKKVRRQPAWRGEIFANHMSNKRLISEYIDNCYNSIIKRWTIQWEIRQRIWIDISPKKTYQWSIATRKDAQCHCSSGKHK